MQLLLAESIDEKGVIGQARLTRRPTDHVRSSVSRSTTGEFVNARSGVRGCEIYVGSALRRLVPNVPSPAEVISVQPCTRCDRRSISVRDNAHSQPNVVCCWINKHGLIIRDIWYNSVRMSLLKSHGILYFIRNKNKLITDFLMILW